MSAEGAEATGGEGVRLSEAEVRTYERIEDSGDTQGLAWRVQETVRAHVAARVQQAEAERDALRERVEALAADLTAEVEELRADIPPVGPGRVAHLHRTAGLSDSRDRLRAALNGTPADRA